MKRETLEKAIKVKTEIDSLISRRDKLKEMLSNLSETSRKDYGFTIQLITDIPKYTIQADRADFEMLISKQIDRCVESLKQKNQYLESL